LLFILVAITIVATAQFTLSKIGHGPPRNDQASLDQLRSQFPQSDWGPNLISAYWESPGDLRLGFNSDDRRLALAACSDLIGVVQRHTITGPDGDSVTYDNDDGSLFIVDRSNNILVTNFLHLHSGCRWRHN
jgi:hypothetical protein